MNYDESVTWIDEFHQYGIKLGLNRIKKVLSQLGNPQEKVSFVHIAGTNGKGSVCRFISSILSSEGYKTGLYLSPHLIDFRERFQLNNTVIKKECFAAIVTRIRPLIEQCKDEGIQLTYFEICTIIAFLFFADENVDYAIIEVGLGGRYDATNVIRPMVSVITNVSLDHQKQLGKTVQEIAFEKAGIIKPHGVVVTAAKNDALEVIQSICEGNTASLNVVTDKMITVEETSFAHQTIAFHGVFDDYLVTTHQLGLYQPINIAVSITAIETLQQQGVFVSKESIYKGIQQMNHPGRMQLVCKHPFFLLDGAHNVDAMKQVVVSVNKLFTFNRLILIFGAMKDKSIREMLTEILPITDIVIVTKPNQKRAAKSEDIAHCILEIDKSKQIMVTNFVVDAYHKAFEIAKKDDLILGTGSLFTVGELIEISEAD